MSKLTLRFADGPIVYFLRKSHNGSHFALCARPHTLVMLNGAETHGERKEERAEANAVAFGLVPFPRGALRRKQTRRQEGSRDGRRGRDANKSPFGRSSCRRAHPADNLLKDKRRESKNMARERFPKLLCRITLPTNLRETISRDGINKKSDGVWIFLDHVTFDDGVTPLKLLQTSERKTTG